MLLDFLADHTCSSGHSNTPKPTRCGPAAFATQHLGGLDGRGAVGVESPCAAGHVVVIVATLAQVAW